jgi:hypothetical protein
MGDAIAAEVIRARGLAASSGACRTSLRVAAKTEERGFPVGIAY